MQGLFRFRRNIGSFQYPVRHRSAKTTREPHRLPLKNSVEPRAQGLGERRIEVAFGPERPRLPVLLGPARDEAAHGVGSLSHLMPVPVCLFVATFDPTVERAEDGQERRTEFVRRSLRHHGQVACASSRFIVSCRARASKRTASRPRMGPYRAAWARSRCSKRAAQVQRAGPNATYIRRSPQALASRLRAVFQRETMAFSRGLGGSMKHWILEASNILRERKRPCISARP